MAKKYQPSGYQIINLDLSGKTSGTGFAPETEDEKLLYSILRDTNNVKPILLHVLTTYGYEYVGFGIKAIDSGELFIYGISSTLKITASSNQLTPEEIEF